MTFDLIARVHIEPMFARLLLEDGGRDKLEKVAQCFADYPDVLDWIGALSGVAQPLSDPHVSLERNEGKRELFLQIIGLIAASSLTDEQAKTLIQTP